MSTDTETIEIGAGPSRFRKGIDKTMAGDGTKGPACKANNDRYDHYLKGYRDGKADRRYSVDQLEDLLRAQTERFGITEFLGLCRAVCQLELARQTCEDADMNPCNPESEAGHGG